MLSGHFTAAGDNLTVFYDYLDAYGAWSRQQNGTPAPYRSPGAHLQKKDDGGEEIPGNPARLISDDEAVFLDAVITESCREIPLDDGFTRACRGLVKAAVHVFWLQGHAAADLDKYGATTLRAPYKELKRAMRGAGYTRCCYTDMMQARKEAATAIMRTFNAALQGALV